MHFLYLQAYLAANSTRDKTSMFFSQRFGIKDSLSFIYSFYFIFFLLLVQHCELGQHFPGFTAIFFPVGVLLFSRSIFIPEQGSFQMQSIKETFIPWLLS